MASKAWTCIPPFPCQLLTPLGHATAQAPPDFTYSQSAFALCYVHEPWHMRPLPPLPQYNLLDGPDGRKWRVYCQNVM